MEKNIVNLNLFYDIVDDLTPGQIYDCEIKSISSRTPPVETSLASNRSNMQRTGISITYIRGYKRLCGLVKVY